MFSFFSKPAPNIPAKKPITFKLTTTVSIYSYYGHETYSKRTPSGAMMTVSTSDYEKCTLPPETATTRLELQQIYEGICKINKPENYCISLKGTLNNKSINKEFNHISGYLNYLESQHLMDVPLSEGYEIVHKI